MGHTISFGRENDMVAADTAIDERIQDVTAAAEASALRLARLNERALDGLIWFASTQHARCLQALRELGDVDLSSRSAGARQRVGFVDLARPPQGSDGAAAAPSLDALFDGAPMALPKLFSRPIGGEDQPFWLTAATRSLALVQDCCVQTFEPLLRCADTAVQGPPRAAQPPTAAPRGLESAPQGATLWDALLAFEKIWADSINDGLEFWRDFQQALREFALSSTSPIGADDIGADDIGAGDSGARDIGAGTQHLTVPDPGQGGSQPLQSTVSALAQADRSPLIETIIRMLLLVCRAAQPSPGECFRKVYAHLETMQPFSSCAPRRLSELINRQAFIIDREPERARAVLPDLLQHSSDRRLALEVVFRLTALAGADEQVAVAQTCRELRMLLPVGPKTGVMLTTVPLPRRQSPEGTRPTE
jgi:hypothetical protein